jgi:Ca2+-binding EF-hand superfamily protein
MGNINTAEFASHFTQKEIQKLYARFKQIDSDGSGDLDPREIFNVPELQQNPLVQRVISIFDINKDGKISFSEFLTGIPEVMQDWLHSTATMRRRSFDLLSRSTISMRTATSPTASSSQC